MRCGSSVGALTEHRSVTGRHARAEIAAFLDADFRQVWAVHRATGDPQYLPHGEAAALRPVAKAEWRCPVPGCLVEITTVGGSRRHHFRHNAPAPHPSDGESENHLAGKAMLAQWAAARLPPGATVREEETVKDPGTAVHRIADVMVTDATGHKVAFEVEYKSWAVDQWRLKQADYDSNEMPCAWLIGHTKVKPHRDALKDPDNADLANLVRLPPLGGAFASAARHILVINPVTKQIGTLSGDPEGTYRVLPGAERAWLWLAPIEDCALHSQLGILTPVMEQIEAATAEREAEAERRRRNEETRSRHLANRLATEEKRRLARQERNLRIEKENQAAWDTSQVRAEALALWPDELPEVLEEFAGRREESWGVHAKPAYWQTALYLALIHERPARSGFTIRDCYSTLTQHRIRVIDERRRSFKALIRFLEALATLEVIAIEKDAEGRVARLIVRGLTLDEAINQRDEAKRLADEGRARESRLGKTTGGLSIAAKRRAVERGDAVCAERVGAAEHARWQAAEDRKAALEADWQASALFAEVTAAHKGKIPDCVTWPGGAHRDAIGTSAAWWRAHIYMRLVHQQPPGTVVTVPDAVRVLRDNEVPLVGLTTNVFLAVHDYLDNLRARGLLTKPDEQSGGGWAVA